MPEIRLAHPNLPGVIYSIPVPDGVEWDLTEYQRAGWQLAPDAPTAQDLDETPPVQIEKTSKPRRGSGTEAPANSEPVTP